MLQKNIPLLQIIPKNFENRYFYANGLSKLIPRLTLKVHSEVEECFYLWDKFSTKKTLFDTWDFRFAWYEGYEYKLYFYTLYEGKNPMAVLPLWFNIKDKEFQWFGSNWMEDNTFFVEDEHFIDLLYAILPSPVELNALVKDGNFNNRLIKKELEEDDPKNIKELRNSKTIDDLLQTFEKKHRYNLRSDFLRIQNLNPKVIERKDKNMDLMQKLIEMNIEEFSKNPDDESDLVIPERAETYRSMVKNAGVYETKFFEVYIQNRLAAIDFIILYKDIYYPIKGGNDLDRFKGIGNFLIYFEFEDAIRNGFSTVDCLQYDYGWKHRFFDQKPLLKLERN